MTQYNFREIEKKWQDKWAVEHSFEAIDFHPTKPKYYVLYEFYNISGDLHMGHLKGSIPADALARYKRFCRYNVLYPIGGDSFGLPAENAALKTGINPHDFVANGMKTAMEQSKRFGLSCDWDRVFATSDPDYYKWTQWIFLKLLQAGKAYKKSAYVNFCPNCKTVLSNEDSQNGKCDRCNGDVIQKERLVWFLKMQEYSEKLLGNIEHITMSDSLKEAQRNWVGKSEGITLSLDIVDEHGIRLDVIEIFTTCIETVYGMTFVVLAPEYALIDKLSDSFSNPESVAKYRLDTSLRSEFDRISDIKDKTGCRLEGLFAVNPVNGKRVPLYIADFVLANYGTGAVMAVPMHDQRDYDFAKAFNAQLIQVIEGDCSNQAVEKSEYLKTNALMMNSAEFSGMAVTEAKGRIAEKVIGMGVASKTVHYKMGDWPFNRQRYWGEPFPVVFCDNCGTVGLHETDLPLILPDTKDFSPTESGDGPLSKVESFVNCTCPKCGGKAKRETDTMPNWAGSSWYWLRHIDPNNNNAIADYEKLKYWGSVDCYTGGTEHITRHVLYSFFWQNFLYEIGAVPTRDPFAWKMGSGLILDDEGKKMSKSSSNGVSPIEIIDQYGADVIRLHVHFLGGYEDSVIWTFKGIEGITSFINRVWGLQELIKDDEVSEQHVYDINRLIKKVSEDIEKLRLNTAIAAFMSFIKKVRTDGFITKTELKIFLLLLNPLAPHITSELFERVFGTQILSEQWPVYDECFLAEDTVIVAIQINGKLSKTITVARGLSREEMVDEVNKQYPGTITDSVKKVIHVPDRIINIVS
jgi:leucyl-tRNA synthetase